MAGSGKRIHVLVQQNAEPPKCLGLRAIHVGFVVYMHMYMHVG